MQAAGYPDGEIDESLGITRPPKEVPPAFIERLKQGNWFYRILGAAGEYGGNYFGDEPPGLSAERQVFLHKFGLMGDLASAAVTTGDVLLRSVPAGIGALGAGVGQAFEEAHDAAVGPGPQAKGKAARDFAQLAQIAALLSGAKGSKNGSVRTAIPGATNGPIIALPRAEDFRNAAASISGSPASFGTEQKLLRLWKEHGIHPNEVAADALHDQGIAEAIASESDRLPEVYAGDKPTAPRPHSNAQVVETGRIEESSLATGPTGSTKDTPVRYTQRDAGADNVAHGGKDAPTEAESGSSQNPGAPEPSNMIAETDDIQMYDPPRKRQRPFTRDYPNEVQADALGQLLKDIEGRPLDADFIAGRRFAGKADSALSVEDMKKAMLPLDIRFALVHPRALPPGVGGMFVSPFSRGRPRGGDIFVSNALRLADQDLTTAHEFSHAIDHFAKTLSNDLAPAEIAELRNVYVTLRSDPKDASFPRQPETFRYLPHQVNRELLAEGIRAYMANPNYFKTVAPKSAARIRAAVNNNQYLKKVIQFNSLLAAGLIGAGTANQDSDNQ